MAIFYIDVSSSQTDEEWWQISEIDGREYVLRFYWNDRYQSWYMDIRDQDESAILVGIRLAVGVIPLGHQVVGDPRMWPGELFLFPQTSDDSDPGRYDLGTRVLLEYDDLQPIGT